MKIDPASRRRLPIPRSVVFATGLLCAVVVGAASAANAGECGDHVNGKRVECQCGDIVVSDTVLIRTDPVTVEPCRADGLAILVPPGSDGITLDLGGQSIVGRGRGVGIHVVHGGRLGSRILGGGDASAPRAEIAGFASGIRAGGSHSLREVKGIDIHANVKDGLTVHSAGVNVEDVVSESNGRRGVSVKGRDNTVTGVVTAGNRRDGIQVRGSGAAVSADASGNGRNGVVLSGRNHSLGVVTSTGNRGVGVVALGQTDAAGVQAADNGVANVVGRTGAAK